jgi:hypothetical protein
MNTLKTLATYEINTDPVDFDAIAAGTKRHMRLGDRGFNVGDYLVMRRTIHPASEVNAGLPLEHGGLEFRCTVASVVRGPDYGLADGWCLLSWNDLPPSVTGLYEPANAAHFWPASHPRCFHC